MANVVFGMMQSLDGYVAGVAGGPQLPPPGIALHRYFNEYVRGLAGILYGRRMYEVMRYWDEDRAEWEDVEHDFAAAWRAQPKWVASRSLKSVGPNATLIGDDVQAFVRRLKATLEGEVDVAGPDLAGSLTDLGLIDEYRLSTFDRSCLAAASRTSPAPVRRSISSAATPLARTRSG